MFIPMSVLFSKDKPAGHRPNIALRRADCLAPGGRDLVSAPYPIVSRKCALLDGRPDEAFAFESVQGGVHGSRRDLARRALHDFVPNRQSITSIGQTHHREEHKVLKLSQVQAAHNTEIPRYR
jgi:hypothetical protein